MITPNVPGPQMHWTFVTTQFPWPLTHGSYLRVYHLTRVLRALGDHVRILAPEAPEPQLRQYLQLGAQLATVPPRTANSRLARRPLSPYFHHAELAATLDAGPTASPSTVVLVGSSALQYAPEAARNADRTVADLIDDPLLEERRRLWREPRPPQLFRRIRFLIGQRRYERVFVPDVDLLTLVSAEDAASLRRRHPGASVATISNGVDVDHLRRPDGDSGDSRTILFLGNLGHQPNIDAVWYLVDDILPRVRQQLPDLQPRLVIVGPGAPPALERIKLDDVQLVGGVEDIRPHLWQAALMAVPMRIGTGVKNKLLEAWAAGLPVVATPLACQGVDALDGDNLLIGGNARALADKIVRLLRSPALRRQLGRRAAESAAARSWLTVASLFRQTVQQLPTRARTPAPSPAAALEGGR